MINIDPVTLSAAQARAYLAIELAHLERAEFASALARGAQRKRFAGYVSTHRANVLALADIVDGPVPDDIGAMSDDELLAALTA